MGVGLSLAYSEWDVTGLVQTWGQRRGQQRPGAGQQEQEHSGWRGFASRKRTAPPNPPHLVVIYRP